MPNADRRDESGSFHHVMNRGLARRTVFETRRDVRWFLAQVARAVRRGELELHAFSILTTHFHLLVRSPRGALSLAMARIQHAYVRWFNRGRRRDGPLFRGRFTSRRVDNEWYERAVRLYIDENAVEAGLARRPDEHPWSSAAARARPRPPRWLVRDTGRAPQGPLPEEERHGLLWLVGERLRVARLDDGVDPLGDLLRAAPAAVANWMRRKAALADGTAPGMPVAAPAAVLATVERVARERPELALAAPLRIALLRDLCGLAWTAAARLAGLSPSTAREAAHVHARRTLTEPDYARAAAEVSRAALQRTHGM